jgi:hypothetical protein
MMKQAFVAAAVCAGVLSGLLVCNLGGQTKKDKPGKPPDSKVAELMQQKLRHAQKVLEGIAVNDLDTIGKNGRELLLLSQKAEWRVFPTPAYLTHSNEFQRVVEKLVKDAKDKNLDGATLAYMEMTMSCVRCHKYVREMRMTRGKAEDRWLAQCEAVVPETVFSK